MSDPNVTGLIFNVQKFSVHDGKGIRTLVFFKGCPLRCLWCSNPESQRNSPERAFNPMRCLTASLCGYCVQACESKAINSVNGMLCNDRNKCVECFTCVAACPSGAQSIYGEVLSVDAILRRVDEDSVFYARSGGGITLSGGEPTMQPSFCLALLREAHRRRINTALETCGYCAWKTLAGVAAYVNELFFDIKCIDSIQHQKFTGVGNERILENFGKLCETYPDLPITVRTPVIPGFNDNEHDIGAICSYLRQWASVSHELLPYHRMGQPKYAYIGKKYSYTDTKLDEGSMAHLTEFAAKHRNCV